MNHLTSTDDSRAATPMRRKFNLEGALGFIVVFFMVNRPLVRWSGARAADLVVGKGMPTLVGFTLASLPLLLLTISVGFLGGCLVAALLPGLASHRNDASLAMARLLTSVAVLIGGRKRAWRAEEWAAGVAAGANSDSPSDARARLCHTAGLVCAAIRLRVGDLAEVGGRVLDWALTEPRTEVLTVSATLCCVGYFLFSSGFTGLMSNLGNVAAAAGLICGSALWLRKRRDIPSRRRRNRASARRQDR